MSTLVWFRSDLRVDDHAALAQACANGERVTALFLVAADTWQRHGWGVRHIAFVWRHVLALRTRLAGLGIPLTVLLEPRFSGAPAAVSAFARSIAARRVCASAEYGVDELARDARVATALRDAGIEWCLSKDFTLLAPGSVRTQEGGPFRVFTPFRRAWLALVRGEHISCFGAPAADTPITPPPLPDWAPLEVELDQAWWPIGEDAALARLAGFVDLRIGRYREDRDIPSLEATSRLAPYLACGVLSVRRCFAAALEHNHGEWDSGNAGVQTWLTELVWREFYVHILAAYPEVSRNQPWRAETDAIPWRAPGEEFTRWQTGMTGFPLVDAGMRQLAATGWMHNRLRMLTAMFLSKHLLIDWRHGERHFMRELVDGELAANNGGWQWSASTGTDAAPYFRILSPERQAERFDPEGIYIRRYVPELALCSTRSLLRPGNPELLATGYPPPMLDTRFARERVMQAFRGAAVPGRGLA